MDGLFLLVFRVINYVFYVVISKGVKIGVCGLDYFRLYSKVFRGLFVVFCFIKLYI